MHKERHLYRCSSREYRGDLICAQQQVRYMYFGGPEFEDTIHLQTYHNIAFIAFDELGSTMRFVCLVLFVLEEVTSSK